MEGLYNNLDQLKGKMKEKVEANRELAFLSRELATIVLDIPFDENFEDMAMSAPDGAALAPLLEELEFRTLSRRLLGDAATSSAAPAATATAAPAAAASGDDSDGQLSMFDAAMEVAPSVSTLSSLDESKVDYTLVDTPNGWAELAKTLADAGRFAFDTETTGLDAMAADLVGMSFSHKSGVASYVPVDTDTWPEIRAVFKPLLESSDS